MGVIITEQINQLLNKSVKGVKNGYLCWIGVLGYNCRKINQLLKKLVKGVKIEYFLWM